MDFRITKAKYNCTTNLIDIEYSGQYKNEFIVIRSDLDFKVYTPTVVGTKLIINNTVLETGGYFIEIYKGNPAIYPVYQTFFYVNCKAPCEDVIINNSYRSEISFDFSTTTNSYNCYKSFIVDFIPNNCDRYILTYHHRYAIDCDDIQGGHSYYSDTLLNQASEGPVITSEMIFSCTPHLWNIEKQSPIETWLNIYDCNGCLLNSFYDKHKSDLYDKFQIGYDCQSGLRYFYQTDLDVDFNGGLLPPFGTKLKDGVYKVKISKRCPVAGTDCKSTPICIDLRVNCSNKVTTLDTTCVEDIKSLIKIENEGNCKVKITNISNKILKLKRVVVTSSDRSCSGDILIQGNEFTIFPTQSQIIDNEGSGYDSKLEIIYSHPSGDGECKSSTCLPYCDLQIIDERNDLKTLVIKKGIVGDDTVATIFNPLTNGIVKATFLVGGKEYTEIIQAGSYTAIKIGSGTKEISYTMASHKNYEVVKKGRAYISKVEEITTGITYTDSTVSGTEITFIVKST